MNSLVLRIFVTVFTIIALTRSTMGFAICAKESVNPSECTYGTTTDYCHNRVCAKAPGESCGGYRYINGKCGEGTYCSCDKCTGCSSITLVCHKGSIC